MAAIHRVGVATGSWEFWQWIMYYLFILYFGFSFLEDGDNSDPTGLVDTDIFLDKETSVYTSGYATCLAIVALGMIAAAANEVLLLRSSKQRAGVSEEDVRARFTQKELDRQGDKSVLYKYTTRCELHRLMVKITIREHAILHANSQNRTHASPAPQVNSTRQSGICPDHLML